MDLHGLANLIPANYCVAGSKLHYGLQIREIPAIIVLKSVVVQINTEADRGLTDFMD